MLRYPLFDLAWRWGITAVALLALSAGIWATLQLWPIAYLGYQFHLPSGVVEAIVPGSPADQAGMQVGDRLMAVYDQPFDTVLRHWNMLQLRDPTLSYVPVVVARDTTTLALDLPRTAPPAAFQASKLVFIVLALLCGLTGWLLGMVRRDEAGALRSVALFWLLLAAILGMYHFARSASIPLLLILRWLLLTVVPPLGLAIHAWFPPRPRGSPRRRYIGWALIGGIIGLNLVLVSGIAIIGPPFRTLVDWLARPIPFALSLSLLGSAILLFRAYQRTTVMHIRRQIRLIGLACLSVALLWAAFLVLPALRNTVPFVSGAWLDLLAGLIPLAYLAGGVLPDVRFLDRLLRQATITLAALLSVVMVSTLILRWVPFPLDPLLLAAVVAVGLYPWLQQHFGRMLDSHERDLRPLAEAQQQLTTSLDTAYLAERIRSGLATAFHHPRLALYLAQPEGEQGFTLLRGTALPDLPLRIPAGALTATLTTHGTLLTARCLAQAVADVALEPVEQTLLHQPDIVRWCPLRHTQRGLVGFLLLGADPTGEPYRREDVQAIQQVIHAAALAFAHSAAYAEQCRAEQTIRRLYHEVQRAKDDTAAAIARDLHDEVINLMVRLNIYALDGLLKQPLSEEVRAEVHELLETEQSVARRLRQICDRLHPSGLDDPYGLDGVLRGQITQATVTWHGKCKLIVNGTPQPLHWRQQWEALRVVREAITNVIKHAESNQIIVSLTYPETEDGCVTITVEDNGHGGMIRSLPGHHGVRNMQESAHSIGGDLSFERAVGSGTRLVLQFPVIPSDTDALIEMEGAYE